MKRKLMAILILVLALFATFSMAPAFAHPSQSDDGISNAPSDPMIAVTGTKAAGGPATDAIVAHAPTCESHVD